MPIKFGLARNDLGLFGHRERAAGIADIESRQQMRRFRTVEDCADIADAANFGDGFFAGVAQVEMTDIAYYFSRSFFCHGVLLILL